MLWRGKSLPCSSSFIEWVAIRSQRLKLLVLFLVTFGACRFRIFITGTESPGTSYSFPDIRCAERGSKCASPLGPRPYVGSVANTHLERNKRSAIRLCTTREMRFGSIFTISKGGRAS